MKDNIMKLFVVELSEALNAENQIASALPRLIAEVESPLLKDALQNHLSETMVHLDRLDRIFKLIRTSPREDRCKAMEGLIKECEDAVGIFQKSPLRDAAIIAKAQRIEHCEIATYGTLRTFANELDLDAAAELLQETLDEEVRADKKLTKIAQGGLLTAGINYKANKSD